MSYLALATLTILLGIIDLRFYMIDPYIFIIFYILSYIIDKYIIIYYYILLINILLI